MVKSRQKKFSKKSEIFFKKICRIKNNAYLCNPFRDERMGTTKFFELLREITR